MASEEISILADELVQLTVKSSLVTPRGKSSLLCSVWTRKTYNPDGFRAQIKSIWKTKRNFEIYTVGQNLFQISFDDEDDLEMTMNGRPWLFRRKIIPCPPERDPKDLMHAIGSAFGGATRRVWLSFKYKSLPNFCFGYGIMSHIVKDCTDTIKQGKFLGDGDLPYSIALKAESKLMRRESLQLGTIEKKSTEQCIYTGEDDERTSSLDILKEVYDTSAKVKLGNKIHAELTTENICEEVKAINTKQGVEARGTNTTSSFTEFIGGEDIVNNGINVNTAEMDFLGNHKKSRWTGKGRIGQIEHVQMESTSYKRKSSTSEVEIRGNLNDDAKTHKKLRMNFNENNSSILEEIGDQMIVPPFVGSAAANRQAYWSQ
ncbi:hypothetical protein PVK06_040595 [Gossypium arboreum]|uniref:DUF4283 domain-containing protein n=1 Tax=Gossypium arboreum TaxID=29729 RepID=A0ABR0N5V3_GOSAR|nr:hypothetical protein PVK06_040595 [Gossypium arboreum]